MPQESTISAVIKDILVFSVEIHEKDKSCDVTKFFVTWEPDERLSRRNKKISAGGFPIHEF